MVSDLDPRAAKAAELMLTAWRDPGQCLDQLPEELRPRDLAEAYAIQQAVIAGLGWNIGGWKVGAASPEAGPTCAPMPLDGLHAGPAHLNAGKFTLRMVEAEVCVRLARNLPAFDAPYSREQIIDAIDTCHPAIEVLQSRFRDPDALDPMTALADSLSHGCFVFGHAHPGWRDIDLSRESVRLLLGGREAAARVANPGGEMIRLIQWLANEGAQWAGGLLAGQYVTTGSWTGKTAVKLGVQARAAFATLGETAVEFA